ncbi:DNA cytosine methyltransferase [Clostridium perfringens]|uniref:DNA cytosine methyltransferase n=2 Tax=Clostridium perfringens TaxID=1502 RepID=UPI000D70A7A2|nr:DNA cytosine methyltransferase [Clostridium perfringens]EGT4140622.1 DNA cytosine methyltransferase [Clostridium perfringens]MBS5968738.1 DNA cytosine methyltransferase [Clostridium perfringens]MDB2046541.1 DNA cytosine methyltransferase [Clostridium perfringens]MDB2056548.1 DNA cytosine methyltransferase [Clostridium perfringens]MDK0802987.1 DNA cytosine methyltransferase [Clostridium perfringens]
MLRTVALFAGCGGLDLGFENAGFNIIWANDNNKKVESTYRYNHKNTDLVIKSLVDIKSEDIPECDIIIGGPPCQSWSLAGAMKGKEDSRGQLFYEYVRVIKDKKPMAFVAENVKGIVSKAHIDSFDEIVEMFKEAGYTVTYKLLNAKNYGVPQDRERVFIVGIRNDLKVSYEFPESTHGKGNYVTLETAIGDLRDNPGEWMEGSFSPIFMSRNRRREWDEVAFTVQASGRQTQIHPDSPKMEKIEKDKWQFKEEPNRKVRRMSVRECARIQTFPDEFKFLGEPINENYKMIGNAVPVKLAEAVARKLRECLINSNDEIKKEVASTNSV